MTRFAFRVLFEDEFWEHCWRADLARLPGFVQTGYRVLAADQRRKTIAGATKRVS